MRYKFICAHIFEFIYFSIHPPIHSTVFIETYCVLGNIYVPNISIECLKYFLGHSECYKKTPLADVYTTETYLAQV